MIPRRLNFKCRRCGTLVKMEQSVPKRRHIKSRRRRFTQKKEYNIQNNGESLKSRSFSNYIKYENKTAAEMKYMRTAGYTRTDCKTNTQIAKELKITPISHKLLEYKRKWITIIIINIKDLTLWSVPSPELQLFSPTFLRSSNCSSSLWSVVIWFQRDSVWWHSLQV